VARIIGALVGPRYGMNLDGGPRLHGDQFGGGMMGGWDDQRDDQRGDQRGGMMDGWGHAPGTGPTATPQVQSN
ncbi:MAG: hypothetical protein RLZZ626_698, partial [Actinomycetota bacterium]